LDAVNRRLQFGHHAGISTMVGIVPDGCVKYGDR
jgi:hypothetical protein